MTSSAPVRGSKSLSKITFSVRQALSRARQGMLHGQVLPRVGVLDPAGERSLEQLALGRVLRRVAVPRDPAARERFVQQWLKENEARVKAGGLASTLLLPAFLTLAAPVQAAAPEMAPLAGHPGVVSITVESDGSVRVELADGRSLALEADAVVIVDGAVFGDAQALAQLGLSAEGAAPLVAVAGLDGVASVTTQADGSALVTMASGAQQTLPPEAIEVREGVVYAPEPALTALPAADNTGAGEGFSPALGLLALGVLGAAAAAGGGGGSGGTPVVPPEPPPPPPPPPEPEPETASGFVIDGYLSGATVTRGDSTVTTDENGGYSDLGGDPNAPIIARGGVDISTGQNFTGTLTAPAGSKVVTPLTTLVQSLVEQGETVENAVKTVQTALGLPDSVGDSAGEQSILNFDPVVAAASEDPEVAEVALSVARAGIQVATVLKTASSGNAEEFSRLANSLATEIKTAPVNLGSAETVQTFLTNAGASEEVIATAGTIAEAAETIATSDSLESAAAAQKAANAEVPGVVPEDAVAPDAPVLDGLPPLVTGSGLTLSGVAVGADQVTLVLRGPDGTITRSASVSDDTFSLTISGEALKALGQGTATVRAVALSDESPAVSAPTVVSFAVDATADSAPAATITFGDALVTEGEAEAVPFTVSGLDADATAVATFSNGASTVSLEITANGVGTVDLSGFDDGTVSSSLAITDTLGNAASVVGGTTVLGLTDPASTSLSAASTIVGTAGAASASFTLSGLPKGASAVVVFTDGATSISVDRAENGAFEVDLSAFEDGAISSSITATTAVGIEAQIAGPSITLDTVVDEAPTATLAVADALVNASEAKALSFTVAGLDEDATAVASFTDGEATVTAAVTGNGAGTADVSSLGDGAITSSLAITDAAGNTASVSGGGFALDTTADEAPAAALVIAETRITAELATAVAFTVSGLDEDATALATFTDGEATVTASVGANGAGTVDLSGLADGAISTSLSITDTAGNTAEVAGPSISLAQEAGETAAVITVGSSLVGSAGAAAVAFEVTGLVEAESAVAVFSDGTDSVSVSVQGNGTGSADLSSLSDGAISVSLRVTRGEGDPAVVEGPSLTLDTQADEEPAASLTVADTLVNASEAEALSFTVAGLDEDASAVASFTDGEATVTAAVTANGAGTVDLSSLDDGAITSSLAITDAAGNTASVSGGGFTLDTTADEAPTASLSVASTTVAAAASGSVGFTVAGLDEDATAVASFTDGTATVTSAVTSNGSATISLTGLDAGSITSSLAITDAAGNTTQVAGASLTLQAPVAINRVATISASSEVSDLEAIESTLQVVLTTTRPLADLALERKQDFFQDLIDNAGSGYASEDAFIAEAGPLYAYRSLLETLQDIASAETPDYALIDFSSSAATSVSSVIGALTGLSVDGAVASAQNIADAQAFLGNMESLRTANSAAFNAIADFAIALNVAGTVTDVTSFRAELVALQTGLPTGQSFAFSDLQLSKEAVGFYLQAFDGLKRGDNVSSQEIMAAPFLDGDDRPTFVNFSNPGNLLKTAFLDGLINQAGLIAEEIRSRIDGSSLSDELKASLTTDFESLFDAVAGTDSASGLLQRLKAGTLTASDFERDPVADSFGPVESLEQLLLTAEDLGRLDGFSDLTAAFGGNVVKASQVTKGISLFEAFGFTGNSGAGLEALLDAMNGPTGLLLLTDQAGAARVAVDAALQAEYEALASDSDGLSAADQSALDQLLLDVTGLIPALGTGEGAALIRLAPVLADEASTVADVSALSAELAVLLGDDQVLGDLASERQQDLFQDLLDNAGDGYVSVAAFRAEAGPLYAYRSLLETLQDIASAETPDYALIDFSSSAATSVSSVIGALTGLSVDGAVASAQNIADAQAFLGNMESLRTANSAAFNAIADFAIALNVAGTVTDVTSFRAELVALQTGLPTGQSFAFSDLQLSKEAVGFYLQAFDGLKRGDNVSSQEIMAAPFLDGDDRPTFVNFSNPGNLLKTAFLDGLINQAGLIAEEIRSRIDGSSLSDELKASLTTDFESLFDAVAGTDSASGLLQRLKAGTLTASDFERDPVADSFGPVESLEQLLLTAEDLGRLDGFSDLTAAFGGNVVKASQVTKGISLFEAFGFTGNSGAGLEALLDAMNGPTGLLLLTDQAGAARVAVDAALQAEYEALASDSDGLSAADQSALDQLLLDVTGLIPALGTGEGAALIRLAPVLADEASTVADVSALSAELAVLLGDDQVLGDLASERQQDLFQDLLDNAGDGYVSVAAFRAEAGPLYAYRSLLETLQDIASAETPDYALIDFSSSAATSVSSVIGALTGLSVDGAVASAQNIADAQAFLGNMESLRTANSAAFNAIADFAIALNVAGTVTDVTSFRAELVALQTGLPTGQSFAFSDLQLSKEAVGFYLQAFDGLKRGDNVSSQEIMAAPFLDGDDRPTFVNFSNPGNLLKTAFLDGLINQAGLVGAEIRDQIPSGFTSTRAEFEALNAQVVGGSGVEEGLLQKLRAGSLTLSDFQRDPAEGSFGPVESLEQLLLTAEDLSELGGEFSDLVARFAGNVVQASQVTRGIDLFDAFAFDVAAGAEASPTGRSPFAGEQALLDAMNGPTGLLLLTDQAGAARDAVVSAINAEIKALSLGSGDAVPDGFATLLTRIDAVIDGLIQQGSSGDDALTGTDQADFIAGAGGSDTLTGGGGDDTFFIDLADDGIDVIADFSRSFGDLDQLALVRSGVGSVVHYEGQVGKEASSDDDVGLYVISSLGGSGSTADRVAAFLDASELFDDAAGDTAFVIAPNLETSGDSDDALLLLVTDAGSGAPQVETVATFTSLSFVDLAAAGGDDLLQVPGI